MKKDNEDYGFLDIDANKNTTSVNLNIPQMNKDPAKLSNMTVNEMIQNKNEIEKKKVRKFMERIENDKGMHSFMSIGSTVQS